MNQLICGRTGKFLYERKKKKNYENNYFLTIYGNIIVKRSICRNDEIKIVE